MESEVDLVMQLVVVKNSGQCDRPPGARRCDALVRVPRDSFGFCLPQPCCCLEHSLSFYYLTNMRSENILSYSTIQSSSTFSRHYDAVNLLDDPNF